jgi:hypothetical protein
LGLWHGQTYKKTEIVETVIFDFRFFINSIHSLEFQEIQLESLLRSSKDESSMIEKSFRELSDLWQTKTVFCRLFYIDEIMYFSLKKFIQFPVILINIHQLLEIPVSFGLR